MPAPKLFLLFAAERSGTHLFRSIISANHAAFAPGEVANAAASAAPESETNFFAFRKRFLLENEGAFVPSQENTRLLTDAFFARFAAAAAAQRRPAAVCDIKYGHVVNFCGGWWDMMSSPFLFEWARRSDVGVIHLVRERVAETCLSNLYAHHTGVWRTKNPADLQLRPLRVEKARLERDMARLQRVVGQFREWLRPCRHREIHYEDLLDGSSASWQAMRDFIGHPIAEIRSDFLKTTPSYDRIIENYAEIEGCLDRRIA